jgi:hypothetical protein
MLSFLIQLNWVTKTGDPPALGVLCHTFGHHLGDLQAPTGIMRDPILTYAVLREGCGTVEVLVALRALIVVSSEFHFTSPKSTDSL